MKTVLDKIYEYNDEKDRKLLLSAYSYAELMHEGQKRASGEAYFTHPFPIVALLIYSVEH